MILNYIYNLKKMIYVGKDVLSLIVKKLDLVDILALKTTCTHFYMKLLKYKAIDKRNSMISVKDFAQKLKPYYDLCINANLASSIIDKLSKEVNYLYDRDDFNHIFGSSWQTEMNFFYIKPRYEIHLEYLCLTYCIETVDGKDFDVEFPDIETRLNRIVTCREDFNSKYVYDCFSDDLKQDFIKFNIDFRVENCTRGTDT